MENILANWIYSRIQPFVSGRVLEVSASTGLVAPIAKELGVNADVMNINLMSDQLNINLVHAYDTVMVMHCVNQNRMVANCVQLMRTDGYLFLQVPACTALYNALDLGFRIWREQNVKYVDNLLNRYCVIVKVWYFLISPDDALQTKTINRYYGKVSVFRKSDSTGFEEAGLSAIVVAKKR
jgi:hypothetical protein